jgi:methylated-DNA-protein-cysteine methyltransferase-like protein
MDSLDDLWRVVRDIPAGRVASYGDVGRLLRQPATGYLVGRWMAQAPPDVPWWRVVAQSGQLVTSKRSPHLAAEQERLLREEGVPFLSPGVVDMRLARIAQHGDGTLF